MSKPKKIAVRYIESSDRKKNSKDDKAKALQEKEELKDCVFC